MKSLVVSIVCLLSLPLISACGEGTYCCTVRTFCEDCSTCSSSETSIGENGDEDACETIVNQWNDEGRFCHAVTVDQEGDVATERFLAMCSE